MLIMLFFIWTTILSLGIFQFLSYLARYVAPIFDYIHAYVLIDSKLFYNVYIF